MCVVKKMNAVLFSVSAVWLRIKSCDDYSLGINQLFDSLIGLMRLFSLETKKVNLAPYPMRGRWLPHQWSNTVPWVILRETCGNTVPIVKKVPECTRTMFPKCLRMPKCTRLQDFPITISKRFVWGRYQLTIKKVLLVLGPRHYFPTGLPAFPLFLFHVTTAVQYYSAAPTFTSTKCKDTTWTKSLSWKASTQRKWV